MNSYILPESFFEPTRIHRTQFFVKKVCNQRWQNTTLNSNNLPLYFKQMNLCSVQVTEFALVFQTNKSLV